MVLLPHSALPLNVFEPRYLALVDDALSGNRLIGMIQPTESEDAVLKPKLSRWAAPGGSSPIARPRITAICITLAGVCRFQVKEEMPALSPYRQVAGGLSRLSPRDLAQSEDRRFSPRTAARRR